MRGRERGREGEREVRIPSSLAAEVRERGGRAGGGEKERGGKGEGEGEGEGGRRRERERGRE